VAETINPALPSSPVAPGDAEPGDQGLRPVRDQLERLLPPGGRGRRLIGWGIVAWTAIGLAVLVGVSWRAVSRVSGVLPFLVMAWLVVFVLNPAVKAMVRRGIPRRLGATVVFLLAVGVMSLLLALLIPVLVHQGETLVKSSPELLKKGSGLFDRLSKSSNPLLRNAGNAIAGWLASRAGSVQAYLNTIIGAGLKLAHFGLVLLLGGFLGYLLLLALPNKPGRLMSWVPSASRGSVEAPLAEMRRIVAGYVRARLIVSAVVGVLATVGLGLIHMPFWLVLGFFVGVANLIPMLGSWIGGIPVAVVSLLTKPPSFLIVVLIVIIVAHAVDGYILSPIVLKETTDLHPVVVLLAVLVGAELLGFWGVLAAIPVAGIIQYALRQWVVPRIRGIEPQPTPEVPPSQTAAEVS
jgi:predicted PurR-regulated permease PerM